MTKLVLSAKPAGDRTEVDGLEARVGVIILNWNGSKDTIECLDSVRRLDYPDFFAVIVDNGSEQKDLQYLKSRLPEGVRLIETGSNLGFSGGNNAGIRSALGSGAEFVVLLNNDTIVPPDLLAELLRCYESVDSPGLISPLIYYYSDRDRIQFRGRRALPFLPLPQSKDKTVWPTDIVLGACFLAHESIFREVGLLPECYFLMGEDMEFSLKVLRSKRRNYCTSRTRIWHKSFRSFVRIPYASVTYSVTGGILFYARMFPGVLGFLAICFHLFAALTIQMPRYPRPRTLRHIILGLVQAMLTFVNPAHSLRNISETVR